MGDFFIIGEVEVFTFALFKGLGSRDTHSFPFGFSTTASPLTHLVGFWMHSTISKKIIHFSFFSNLVFKVRDIFLTGVTTGYRVIEESNSV